MKLDSVRQYQKKVLTHGYPFVCKLLLDFKIRVLLEPVFKARLHWVICFNALIDLFIFMIEYKARSSCELVTMINIEAKNNIFTLIHGA